ncbi:hypothetical protein VYU27_008524 [Nannochloropsis oceanica]
MLCRYPPHQLISSAYIHAATDIVEFSALTWAEIGAEVRALRAQPDVLVQTYRLELWFRHMRRQLALKIQWDLEAHIHDAAPARAPGGRGGDIAPLGH